MRGNYCLSIVLLNKLQNKRDHIINKLKENGIGTSIYYPRAIPEMKYYKMKYNLTEIFLKNASKISKYSISFIGPHIKNNQVIYYQKT